MMVQRHWFTAGLCIHIAHTHTLSKPESFYMHFSSGMFYNVDALILLSNTRQC